LAVLGCTWDGQDYGFEADIYPTGKLGLWAGAAFRKPYPHDDYLLRYAPDPVAGFLDLRLVEERHEANYLDEVGLFALDLQADRVAVAEIVSVFPAGKLPPEEVIHTVAIDMANPVVMTHVDAGADVGSVLAASDKDKLMLSEDNNASTWQTLELDLGAVAGAPQLKLVIDANTVFPSTPEGYQNRRDLDPTGPATRFEVEDDAGGWVEVDFNLYSPPRPKEFGRVHIVDITGMLPAGSSKVRLRYCMKVYIDAIWVDTTADVPFSLSEVPLDSAILDFHGPSEKTSTTDLYEFDYDVASDRSILLMPGNYTQYGDVTPLLAAVDDMLVIFGIGDQIRFRFPDPGPAPAGQKRQFMLYSNGYYKAWKNQDIAHTVEPLPFAAMSNFPYDEAVESYPTDPAHQDYRATWNTRIVE
jgi:hypothetical protein